MRLRELLSDRIENHGLCPGATSLELWQRSNWIRFPIAGWDLPVLPLYGLRHAHRAHDVHHALGGFPTTIRGEFEVAAWELASGGCARNAFFWLDRLIVAALGLVFAPLATLRAARSAHGCSNFYGTDVSELFDEDVDALRRRLGCAR